MEYQYLKDKIAKDMREPAKFEAICEDYLKTFPEYECLYTKGTNPEGKTIRGIPDSLLYDFKSRAYIAFEYSTEKRWKQKAAKSINAVEELFKEETLKCKRIVICTDQEVNTNGETGLRKNAENAGMELDLYDVRRIVNGIIDLPNLLYKHFAIEPQIRYFELLDKKLKSRRGFLPNFPKLEDFENRLVFMDKREVHNILKFIGDKNMCLLYGKPAAGKTVFAFAFGKNVAETYLAYYLNIKTESNSDKLLQEVKNNNNNQVLYIIDDCHISPEDVYRFIELIEANNIKSKFLFISRDSRSFLGQDDNYFEVLRDASIQIKIDEIVLKNIIDMYEDYKCKELSDYTKKEYNVRAIMRKCGRDLFFLSYFLNAWDPKETRRSLDEVKEEEIFDMISKKYLEPYASARKRKVNSLLVSLSALYQFEFSIESPFFYSKIKDFSIDPNEEEKFLNEGLIEVSEREGEILFFLPHSTFASLLLKTAEKKCTGLLEGKSIHDYTKEICLEYLEKEPKYILNIVRLLSNKGRKDIAQKYIENDYFVEKINGLLSEIHFTNIKNWIEFLNLFKIDECYKEKIFGDKVTKRVADKLKEGISFQSFVWFLKRLIEFDKLKGKALFESLDNEVVAKRLKDEKLINVQKFFEKGAEVGVKPEKIREVLKDTIDESFLLKIEESSLMNLYMLLRNLKRISKSSFLNDYLLKKLTAKGLSQVFKKINVSVKYIGCILEYANNDFAREFVDCFDEEFFVQSYNRSKLNQIGKFIFNYSNYDSIYLTAYRIFERDYLNKKLQDSPIRDIQKFISRISKIRFIGGNLAKGAINELRKMDIKKNISIPPTKIELDDIDMLIDTVSLFDNTDFIVYQLKDVLDLHNR